MRKNRPAPHRPAVPAFKGLHSAVTGRPSLESTIGSKIDALAGPDGCWYYSTIRGKYAQVRPYGRQGNDRGEIVMVHRFTYTTLVGPIPKGHDLHHKCENKACVNPRHLQPVTPAEHAAIHAELRRERTGAA